MMLKSKNALIYGAGGSMAGAVARAMAAAGATVYLTGRNIDSVQRTADDIISRGGKAEVDVVDALNEQSVEKHIQRVAGQAGSVDISFNAIGIDVKQDIPLIDLAVDDYVTPVSAFLRTSFLTATAAGRIMKKQGSGVILTLTATPGGIGYPLTGGFAAACCGIESLSRNLGSELGVYGVRTVNIRSGGSPDSRIFADAIRLYPDLMKEVLSKMEADTMLKKLPLMIDIANTAVFLASDMAAKITGVSVDVTAGTTAALNYRSVGQ
jgi:3-oxoacyl-[acyl-carrier protein] reductase